MDCHLLYINFKVLKKLKKRKSGFTLVELIVVMAIIGVLAAIIVPNVFGYLTTARLASMQSDAKGIYNDFAAAVTTLETKTGVAAIDPAIEAVITRNSGGVNEVTLTVSDMSTFPDTRTISHVVGDGVAKCEYGIYVKNRASGTVGRVVAIRIILYDFAGNYAVCDEGDTVLYNPSGVMNP